MPRKKPVPKPFRALNRRLNSRNRCFYCGQLLRDKASKEHVFPKWLQEKFGLRNQTIHLLNGTTIQYSKLTVPCCHRCNTVHLSKLENRVKRYLFSEPIAVARKHSADLLIWSMKILLGIIYAERLLPWQRSKPRGRRIIPSKVMNDLSMTHFFVQGLDLKIEFEAEGKTRIPGSIFIFNLKTYKDRLAHFHFRDDLNTLTVFMRLGNRGIIATADGGALDIAIGAAVKRDGAIKLHPKQFDEIGAKVFYKASLFNRTPTYITMHHNNRYRVMQLPLMGLSDKPVFNRWEHNVYAHYLALFMNTEVENVSSADGALVSTLLYDKENRRVRIPI